MKRGIIDRWDDLLGCKNLLFFAQTVDELIFNYSIPSHRLSTLNSHFLCYDAIRTINDIDHNGVPEGSLRPIFEELYYALERDPVFPSDESPLKYFVKEQRGKYIRSYNPNDFSYTDKKNIVFTLQRRVFGGNNYFTKLKEKITNIVIGNVEDEQDTLFSLTKSLITELVNLGYDQRYIRDVLVHNFFNTKKQVTSPKQIEDFFETFPCTQRKYKVVLIADQQLQTILTSPDPEKLKVVNRCYAITRIPEERQYLRKKDSERYYIFQKESNFDPYSAAKDAELFLKIAISFYVLFNHSTEISLENAKFIVYDENKYYTIISPEKSAVLRMKTPKYHVLQQKIEITHKAVGSGRSAGVMLLLAANLHSLSLKSTSEENQLLDLWAIIECVLNISQEHTTDRITQVCSYLVPIIKYRYIYTLFEQLLNDVKNYDNDKYNEIIHDDDSDFQKVFSFAKYVLLEPERLSCDTWLQSCNDFPLLKFRIQRYREVFNTRGNLAKYIEGHSQRVRWQIMRAYRNRNLIIHNGETMSYTTLLVENLHAYVDALIEYIIIKFAEGHTIESMRQELFANECEWCEQVEKKNSSLNVDALFLEYAMQQ